MSNEEIRSDNEAFQWDEHHEPWQGLGQGTFQCGSCRTSYKSYGPGACGPCCESLQACPEKYQACINEPLCKDTIETCP